MSPPGPSDADLITRVLLQDDRHAFATLVRRHQSPVRSFLRRLTMGDTALADDLAQETFLRAYKHLAAWRGQGRFSSWLLRIAYRVFVSEARRVRTTREEVRAELPEEGSAPAQDGVHLQKDLERAMRGLSEEERVALALCFGQDLTHEEAAAVLGWPLGTVKTHITRGKEKLRVKLQGWNAEGAA